MREEWVFFFDLRASDILTFCSSRQTHFTRLSITEKVSKKLLQCNLCNMGSLTDRETLIRCIKQLLEKVVVDQHYRPSERGTAGRF